MAYITFEGIDGSGKTTQYKLEVKRLKASHGGDAISEYRYSAKDNPIGRLIKQVYGQSSNGILSRIGKSRVVQETLYALNARQNLRGVNQDARILVSDRSIVTAHASHIGLLPEWLLNVAEPRLYPDLAVFIDISPETGMQRISQEGRDALFKDESLEEMQRFRENYQKILDNRRPKTLRDMDVIVVNGEQSLEEVTAEVRHSIDTWLHSTYDPERRLEKDGRTRFPAI